MNTVQLETKRLTLVAQTREHVSAQLEQMPPETRAQVSPAWVTMLESSSACDPWIHGFVVINRTNGVVLGQCGFKGPPGPDGIVEIAYGIAPAEQGKGYATEAAEALVHHAFSNPCVRIVCAHTLPQPNASARVLTKCGFKRVGEVMDPEDGRVWRWEKTNS